MRTLTAILATIMFCPLTASAQDGTADSPTTRLLLGVGSHDVLDTYLSPYSYKGEKFGVTLEKRYSHTMHRTHIFFGCMKNPAKNTDEFDAGLTYSLAHHFRLIQSGNWTVQAGPMGQVRLGCLYNRRNGNNPAQAKVSLMAHASAAAAYSFNLRDKEWTVEGTVDVPVIGLAFSPQFGQSYYEVLVGGDYDHNCVPAHTFNTPSVEYRLLLDFPLGHSRCYLGYNGQIHQTTYNNLRYHAYTHSVVVGIKL